MSRTAAPLLVLVFLLSGRAASSEADEDWVELHVPASIHDLRLADADGDGVRDILLLEGRRLRIFRGRPSRLPAPTHTLEIALPDTVSFVDLMPGVGGAPPALLTIGTTGTRRMPLKGKGAPRALEDGLPTAWRDDERVAFVRLAMPDGGLLLPSTDGWIYRASPQAAPIRLTTVPSWSVRAPGPFLEDTCDVTVAWNAVYVGAAAHDGASDGGAALWTLARRSLVARSHAGRVQYDLSFLRTDTPGRSTDQLLLDLDGDDRPELMHRIFNNREARYGFFRTKPLPTEKGTVGPTHKPAASDMYLSGFPLDPELVDLDGDGLKDLVLTSIEIDAANTLRALGSGKVTAKTHAFLNRWQEGRGRYFHDEADAVVKSDIGVRVQFNYAGTIEVERSFTIIVDGDYDGDGRKDLAIRTRDNTLTIRRGLASGVWEKKGRKVPIPPLGDHPDVDGRVADLDGDGRDELVLHYRKPAGGSERIWVVRPRP